MKYILSYHGCSAAARKNLGEICGGYMSEVFDTEEKARTRLKELRSRNDVWEINDVSIKEEIPVSVLTFGYNGETVGAKYRSYHYEQEDLNETLKAHRAAARSKSTKSISPLFVYKKLPI